MLSDICQKKPQSWLHVQDYVSSVTESNPVLMQRIGNNIFLSIPYQQLELNSYSGYIHFFFHWQ